MAKKRKGTNQGRKQQPATQDVPFEALQRALRWIINEDIFSQLTLHGNVPWTAGPLVVLAVLSVWSDQATLTGAFAHAKHLTLSMLGDVALPAGTLGRLDRPRAHPLRLGADRERGGVVGAFEDGDLEVDQAAGV